MEQNKYTQAQNTFNLREFIYRCLANWHLFAISLAVCFVLVILYMMSTTKQFQVTSTLMLQHGPEMSSMQEEMISLIGLGVSKDVIDELEILSSRNLFEQSIRALDLQSTYRKKEGMRWMPCYPVPDVAVRYPYHYLDTMRRNIHIEIRRTENVYKIKVEQGSWFQHRKSTHAVASLVDPIETCVGTLTFVENKPLKPGDKMRIVTNPMSVAVDIAKAQIRIAQVKKESNMIRLNAVNDSPKRTIDLMSKLIDLYNLNSVADKNIITTNTADFIEDRLRIITLELDTVEHAVEQYMQRNQLSDINKEIELALEAQSDYQNRLAKIETQLNLVGYLQEYLQDKSNSQALIPVSLGIEDASLQTLATEYNAVMLERMRIAQTATADNPMLAQTDMQLAAMRQSILESIANIRAGLEVSQRDLLAHDRQFQNLIRQVPTKQRQFVEIKRQQQIKERLYLYLFEKREETALALATVAMPAKVIDKPARSSMAVAPRIRLLLLIAFILGLALPVAYFYLYDIFNNTIASEQQFTQRIQTPILGQIAQSKEAPVVRMSDKSVVAEMFRMLRTNLMFMLDPRDKRGKVILVTSNIQGEGKTFVAINTALSIAGMGRRVVLVGLDIRRPMFASYLGLAERGCLTQYLAGEDLQLQDMMYSLDGVGNVSVIPAGIVPPNPAELLTSDRLDELIEKLREQFDYVIVDSAPVAVVSDTFVLNRIADLTMFVCREHRTPLEMTEAINEYYRTKRFTKMACVLNGVKQQRRTYGYGYGYGY